MPPAEQELSGVRFLDDERRALANLAEQFSVPPADLGVISLHLSDLDVLPQEIARRHKVLPLLVRAELIFLAMVDPSDRQAIEEVEFVCGRRVVPFVSDADRLAGLVDSAYAARAHGDDILPAEQPSVPFQLPSHLTVPPAPIPPGPAQVVNVGAPSNPTPDTAVTLRPPKTETARLVFVIDPDANTRDATTSALRDHGYRVEPFDRASTVLSAVAREHPALVIIDPALPDQHGFDLCAALRARADLAVVIVTDEPPGWRLADDLADSLSVRAFVRKSTLPAELAARVTEVLSTVDSPRPSSEPDAALPPAADAALTASTEAYQRGDLDGAIAALDSALRDAPNAWRLRYHLALLLSRNGEVFRAVQQLEASVSVHHGFYPALKNLALLYERVGFRRKAIEAWERSLPVAPDAPTRASIKDHLVTLL